MNDDLVPPVTSISLPELFSPNHEIVPVMRESFSSSELLYERAMERFYHAVAIENAELTKQTERKVGILAHGKQRSRLLSSPDHAKSSQRRSSEGQPDLSSIKQQSLTMANYDLLANKEQFHSDPSLPGNKDETESSEGETNNWRKLSSANSEGIHQLQRWHDSNMLQENDENMNPSRPNNGPSSLSDAMDDEMSRLSRNLETLRREAKTLSATSTEDEDNTNKVSSIEYSEDSNDDSEDIQLLKTKILERPVINEEDTYHPRGLATMHVKNLPGALPPLRIPSASAPSSTVTSPLPSPNIMPKSILKKRTESDVIPVNSFGRPIPPEKPIRKVLSRPDIDEGLMIEVEQRRQSLPPKSPELLSNQDRNRLELPRNSIVNSSESDTDNSNLLSAGEVAKNRRRSTGRLLRTANSITDEESQQLEKQRLEERMAVVDHYTEIVREHSHTTFPSRSTSLPRFTTANKTFSPERTFDNNNHSRRNVVSHTDLPSQDIKVPTDRPRSIVSPQRSVISPQKNVTIARELVAQKEPIRQRGRSPGKRHVVRESPFSSSQERETPVIKVKVKSRGVSRERNRISVTPEKSEVVAAQRKLRGPSVERVANVRRKSTSRSSSKDRHSSGTNVTGNDLNAVKSKLQNLQRQEQEESDDLPVRRGVSRRRGSRSNSKYLLASQVNAQVQVKSTMVYLTDLTLLIAAIYVYLFKKEIFAIPFLALLFYRHIQEGVHRRLRGWRIFPRRQ